MYIELKTGYSDDGPAWIGYVKTSKTKKTIYFNDHAFQKYNGGYSNYVDIENGDEYWITTLQLFHKKISYRTFWCIMNLTQNITKESDPVRQKHYTTKKHWLVDFINIFWFILKLFLFRQQIPYFCWYYPYWHWNPHIPSGFCISIFYPE